MSFRQKLWSASFSTTPELAEALAASVEDALAVSVYAPPRTGKADIQAIYDYAPHLSELTARLTVICAIHKAKTPTIRIAEVPSLDWLQKVAEDFPPLRIARWTVHGAQHRKAVPNRRHALQIDATSAFGTGEHPTTRGCLLMLDDLLKCRPVRRTLDMGCGSGILAMGCTKARPGTAVAVDLDPDSVTIARNNARANGLQNRLKAGLSRGYRARMVRDGAPYDLIMSNIFAVPLSHMAKDLRRHLQPGGMVILSGLLSHQANRVLSAHRLQKLYLVKRLRLGEWSVLALKRRTRAK